MRKTWRIEFEKYFYLECRRQIPRWSMKCYRSSLEFLKFVCISRFHHVEFLVRVSICWRPPLNSPILRLFRFAFSCIWFVPEKKIPMKIKTKRIALIKWRTTSNACSRRRATFRSPRSRSFRRLPLFGRDKNGLYWSGFVTISWSFFTAWTENFSQNPTTNKFFFDFLPLLFSHVHRRPSYEVQELDVPNREVLNRILVQRKTRTKIKIQFTIDHLFEFVGHCVAIFDRLFKIVLTFFIAITKL